MLAQTPALGTGLYADNKPSSKVVLDELRAEINKGNEVPIPVTQVSPLVARIRNKGALS